MEANFSGSMISSDWLRCQSTAADTATNCMVSQT